MSSQKIEFNVKEGSIKEFFKSESDQYFQRGENFNSYYLLKDVIHIPKHKLQEGVNCVNFQLNDFARGSGKSLVNTYSYSVEDYDSVSYELVPRKFDVQVSYPI